MVTDGRARRLTGAAVGRTEPAERDLRVGALRSSMRLALVSSGAHSSAVRYRASGDAADRGVVQMNRSAFGIRPYRSGPTAAAPLGVVGFARRGYNRSIRVVRPG